MYVMTHTYGMVARSGLEGGKSLVLGLEMLFPVHNYVLNLHLLPGTLSTAQSSIPFNTEVPFDLN